MYNATCAHVAQAAVHDNKEGGTGDIKVQIGYVHTYDTHAHACLHSANV